MTDNRTLQAIETEYKGFRFRSRLEARWAVFLDAVKLPWTYEPEGFELGPAGRYLPDFYLPSIKTWMEIKPGFAADINRDWSPMYEWEKTPGCAKAEAFGAQLEDDHRLVVIHGDPWPGAYFAEVFFRESWDGFYLWCQCPKCGAVNIHWEGASNRNCECVPREYQGDASHNLPTPTGWHSRVDVAFREARSARFGERGR